MCSQWSWLMPSKLSRFNTGRHWVDHSPVSATSGLSWWGDSLRGFLPIGGPLGEHIACRNQEETGGKTGEIQVMTRTTFNAPSHPRQDMLTFTEVRDPQYRQSCVAN